MRRQAGSRGPRRRPPGVRGASAAGPRSGGLMEWSRRSVLGAGVAAAATALTRPAKGSSLHDETGPAQAKPPKPFALEELTIRELSEGLVAQRYTSRQLTEAYLARIEEVDRKGPGLRA